MGALCSIQSTSEIVIERNGSVDGINYVESEHMESKRQKLISTNRELQRQYRGKILLNQSGTHHPNGNTARFP